MLKLATSCLILDLLYFRDQFSGAMRLEVRSTIRSSLFVCILSLFERQFSLFDSVPFDGGCQTRACRQLLLVLMWARAFIIFVFIYAGACVDKYLVLDFFNLHFAMSSRIFFMAGRHLLDRALISSDDLVGLIFLGIILDGMWRPVAWGAMPG